MSWSSRAGARYLQFSNKPIFWASYVAFFLGSGTSIAQVNEELPPDPIPPSGRPNQSETTDPYTGAARFRYPIELPPGTNGMAPDLALKYDSQSAWGQSGYGWQLVGIDAVRRSVRHGAPRYDDSDTFRWGTRHLVLGEDGAYHTEQETFARIERVACDRGSLATSLSSLGVGTGAGALWPIFLIGLGIGCFAMGGLLRRGRLMGSTSSAWTVGVYAVISACGPGEQTSTIQSEEPVQDSFPRCAGDYWLVTLKSGIQYRYGFNRDSRIESEHGGEARAWALDRIKDPNGNYVEFRYIEETDNVAPGIADADPLNGAAYYPERIIYTKNDRAPLNLYRTVKFGWQNRPDARTSYQEGTKVRTTRRLRNIRVLVGTDRNGEGGDLLRRYELEYVQSGSDKSLLSEIRLCGTDEVCQGSPDQPGATVFSYYDYEEGFGEDQVLGLSAPGDNMTDSRRGITLHDLVDIDGDLRPDSLSRHRTCNAGGTNCRSNEYHPAYAARFNQESGFQEPAAWEAPFGKALRESHYFGTYIDILDINGDGLPDQLLRHNWVNPNIGKVRNPSWPSYDVALGHGFGFGEPREWLGGAGGDFVREGTPRYGTVHTLIDMNGDGRRDDVFRFRSYNINRDPKDGPLQPNFEVRLNHGTGFIRSELWETSIGSVVRDGNEWGSSTHELLDMNGDGLPDEVFREDGGDYWVRLNHGRGFAPRVTWGDGDGLGLRDSAPHPNEHRIIQTLVDMNGDGLPDIVGREDQEDYRVRLNNGAGFERPMSWGPGVSETRGVVESSKKGIIKRLMDINGDGLPDDVYRYRFCFSGCQSSPSHPDFDVRLNRAGPVELLRSVRFSAGGKTTYSYAPAANYDNRDEEGRQGLPFPLWVVERAVTEDGLGASFLTDFHYAGGLYDPEFRELRGFRTVTAKAPEGTTVTDFYQDMARSGIERVVEVRNPDAQGGQLLRRSVWDYAVEDRSLPNENAPLLFGNDRFDHGSDGWSIYNSEGAASQIDESEGGETPPSLYVSGDHVGFEKRFHLQGWRGEHLRLHFNFRVKRIATSRRRLAVSLTLEADGTEIKSEAIFQPAGRSYPVDSGWQTFLTDLTDAVPSSTRELRVIVEGNRHIRELWIDDVRIEDAIPQKQGAVLQWARKVEERVSEFDGQTSPRMSLRTFGHDSYGNVIWERDLGDTSITGDERESTFRYGYDIDAWILDRVETSSVSGFDAQKNWSVVRRTDISYDQRGNLIQIDRMLGNGTVTQSYGRDVYGNVIWNKDGNVHGIDGWPTNSKGHSRDLEYDPDYQTVAVVLYNALNQQVRAGIDPFLRVDQKVDVNRQKTVFAYDQYSRLAAIVRPGDFLESPTLSYTYIEDGLAPEHRRVEQRQINGLVDTIATYESIDGLGRSVQTQVETAVDTEWRTEDRSYDFRDRLVSQSVSYFDLLSLDDRRDLDRPATTFKYDALDRELIQTFPDQTFRSTQYDRGAEAGLDRLGRVRIVHRTVYGEIERIDEFGGSTTYSYHSGTRELLSIVDPNENEYAFTYDTMGRKTGQADLDLGAWSYRYDPNGNLTDQIDGRGVVTIKKYDALNRLLTQTTPDRVVTQVYDEARPESYNKGLLTTRWAADPDGQSLFTRTLDYDDRSRMIRQSLTMDGQTWGMELGYDAADRLISRRFPDGEVVTYDYLGGQLDRVAGVDVYLQHATYTSFEKLKSLSYGNGTALNYGYYDQIRDFDPIAGTDLSFMLKALWVSGGDLPLSLGYQYDRAGNVRALLDQIEDEKSQSFTYDDLNRIESANGAYGSKVFRYDGAGNIVRKDGRDYEYVEGNRVRNDGLFAYTYDGNGNVRTRTSTDFAESFTYDGSNRLVASFGRGDAVYLYDGETRIKKIERARALAEGFQDGFLAWQRLGQGAISGFSDSRRGPIGRKSGDSGAVFRQLDREVGNFELVLFTRRLSNTASAYALTTASNGGGYGVRMDDQSVQLLRWDEDFSPVSLAGGSGLGNHGSWRTIRLVKGGSELTLEIHDGITTDFGVPAIALTAKDGSYDSGFSTVSILGSGEFDTDEIQVRSTDRETTYYIDRAYESVFVNGEQKEKIHHYYAGDQKIASRDGQGLKYRYPDHLNSAVRIADRSGKEMKALWYTPFGSDVGPRGTARVRYKFNGKEQDGSGLYDYGARYYDPSLGRFLAADTLLPDPYDPQQLNRFAYVRNNPVKLIDPDGHITEFAVLDPGIYSCQGCTPEIYNTIYPWTPAPQPMEQSFGTVEDLATSMAAAEIAAASPVIASNLAKVLAKKTPLGVPKGVQSILATCAACAETKALGGDLSKGSLKSGAVVAGQASVRTEVRKIVSTVIKEGSRHAPIEASHAMGHGTEHQKGEHGRSGHHGVPPGHSTSSVTTGGRAPGQPRTRLPADSSIRHGDAKKVDRHDVDDDDDD